MGADDGKDQRQSQSVALQMAAGITAEEPFENMFAVVFIDSAAGIFDLENDFIRRFLRLYKNRTFLGEFQGVFQQVGNDSLEF